MQKSLLTSSHCYEQRFLLSQDKKKKENDNHSIMLQWHSLTHQKKAMFVIKSDSFQIISLSSYGGVNLHFKRPITVELSSSVELSLE